MLELKNICKTYYSKSGNVNALKGVSITFPDSQFVSILGPSGCGKTTLLNIIGGLDNYTSGDYVINGVSTKDYKEQDWNTFRNHSVGFVFQSYNLIPHQNVLSNVEMALTLSGVSRKERKQRAIEALKKVGLESQIHKKPNQLSGGQAQRVAIARAIVNEPDIILADEPTGALDSETSVQVMEILKELSKNVLVVMVTHNPDLAHEYSDRILRLSDGLIIDDTVYNEVEQKEIVKDHSKKNKAQMSFVTSFMLSLSNLLSKKSRTILTAIAGSIGIIGITLVLALSTGFQSYIDKVQKDSLSSYPITVTDSSFDLSSIMSYRPANIEKYPGAKKIFVNQIIPMIKDTIKPNNLNQNYINTVINNIPEEYVQNISYSYPVLFNIFKSVSGEDRAYKINESLMSGIGNTFSQLLSDKNQVLEQYDILAGHYPTNPNEVVISIDNYNQMTDLMLQTLYMPEEIYSNSSDGTLSIDFDKILGQTFKFVVNDVYFTKVGNAYKQISVKDPTRNDALFIDMDSYNDDRNIEIKIVGVMRLKPDTTTGIMGQMSAIGYLPSLVDSIYETSLDSEVVNFYKQNKDAIVALFGENGEELYKRTLNSYGGDKTPSQINIYPSSFNAKEEIKKYLDSENDKLYNKSLNEYYSGIGKAYYELHQEELLGLSEEEIQIKYLEYGNAHPGTEEEQQVAIANAKNSIVKYADIMSIIVSSVSTIIDAISYVLIAFTSISLIVSSIMIGVITYISVIERTKEIGILRAVGARRVDVFRIFTAETFIIGLISGIFGCLVTFVLCFPINAILESLAGIQNVAGLQFTHALIIIVISFILTVVAGLIPSSKATKIDPVVALRAE